MSLTVVPVTNKLNFCVFENVDSQSVCFCEKHRPDKTCFALGAKLCFSVLDTNMRARSVFINHS